MKRGNLFDRYSPWTFVASFFFSAVLLGLVVIAIEFLKPELPVSGVAPTIVVTIVPAPTSTEPAQINLFATPTPTPQARTLSVGGISQGMYVQIFGTGGDGLRLRRDAGTSADILFLGYESEVFQVVDGPKEADGFVWWYLTAPYDEKRSGWAASNFLRILDLDNETQP
ncbi:MAG: hypothetical protein AB1453_04590 [Chloroflexota bacterium]|jgi:hypothetical protein